MKRPLQLCNAPILGNRSLCDEHGAITLWMADWPTSHPGQFVHLCPPRSDGDAPYRTWEWGSDTPFGLYEPGEACGSRLEADLDRPMIRRAFSIADLRPGSDGTEIDVIYRVVGKATRWLAGLTPGNRVDVLGPLGTPFPTPEKGRPIWLVAGGVGLPPLMWLGKALAREGGRVTVFVGARTRRLLPLSPGSQAPDPTAKSATRCLEPFAGYGIPAVAATDDGSWGFAGRVGQALRVFASGSTDMGLLDNEAAAKGAVIYTCGPEPMMADVARFAREFKAACWVCLERSMACGLQTCQSCVVPVASESAEDGWRYALCCTEGPVFDAERVLWTAPRGAAR